MSKAVVFHRYGDADVLELMDFAPPQPQAGQVRVRVKAAGVQPFDCLFRSGAAAQWMPARFPQRLGNEFAGVIDALGEEVKGFALGDEVLGWAMLDSYAEHLVVDPEQIVAKPAAMPWAEAGVLSASAQTAATALKQLAVTNGETLLIHAAAGGVGSFAVQIATAMGATVIGTASERNHAYLRELGAIPVTYGDSLLKRIKAIAPQGVDAALVAVNSDQALAVSLDLVDDRKRIGTVAFQPAADKLAIQRISSERSAAQLTELTKLYDKGKLRVFIQQAYPLPEAAAAHRLMETGHVRGKLALVV